MEEGYDEELEKLLGEIPRATSTPPHLEVLQTVLNQLSEEEVSHDMDAPTDETAHLMETFTHHSLLCTPFSEPPQTSLPLSTHGYEDPQHLLNPLSPFYKSLPRDLNDMGSPNELATSQVRHLVDFNLTYSDGLSQVSPDYKAPHSQVVFPCTNQEKVLTLQHESQGYAEQGKIKRNPGSFSSGAQLEVTPHLNVMSAVTSNHGSCFSTFCLPSSLQSLDPTAHNASASVENELHNKLGKLALAQHGLTLEERPMTQPCGMRFVHSKQNVLERQGVRQLPDQSIALLESAIPNVANAAMLQLGSPHTMANGAFVLPRLSGFVPPYLSDLGVVYAQRMHEAAAAAAQQQIGEQVLCRQRIKEEFLLRQQKLQEQQAQFYASLQSQPGPTYPRYFSGMQHNHPAHKSSCMYDTLQQQPMSKTVLLGGVTPETNLPTAQMWAPPSVCPGEAPEASDFCQYCFHGFCNRGDVCPFTPSRLHGSNSTANNELISSESCLTLRGPRNGLIAPTLVTPTFAKTSQLANGHAPISNGNHMSSPKHSSSTSGGVAWNGMDPEILQSASMQHFVQQPLVPPQFTTLKEVEGHIYGIAKDQHGCRFLQRKFEEGIFEDVQKIFVEIIDHVVELMTDPFGNYLVQKLLEVCNEAQRMEILYKVTGKDQLVTISLNMHGTRAVQKLIETLNAAEQVRLVVASLKQGVVTLIKDLNGNHVVQRCLQRLSMEDSQFIFDAAACHCVDIATHRHGCCVLQRCVDFSSGQQRNGLVAEIAANALVLSQDPFGNYVVQYILDLGLAWAIEEVVAHLDGNYVHLAMQKFSSNVVEKCLKLSGEESRAQIIRELISSARLAQLLQDPFANYVVQSALVVSKGVLHFGLVEAIRPHLPSLRSSPYGKRILSRTNLKK